MEAAAISVNRLQAFKKAIAAELAAEQQATLRAHFCHALGTDTEHEACGMGEPACKDCAELHVAVAWIENIIVRCSAYFDGSIVVDYCTFDALTDPAIRNCSRWQLNIESSSLLPVQAAKEMCTAFSKEPDFLRYLARSELVRVDTQYPLVVRSEYRPRAE